MPKQPNILLFISDQQRTDTMKCYGNDWVQSPHQDALAERSFVFDNTYVTQPVCTPARGSLMTGLYPHSHGCVVNREQLRDEIPSIAEMLPNAYRKAMFGKWHLGDDSVRQHGFDEWISTEDDHRNKYSRPGLPFSSYYYWMKAQGIAPQNNSVTGEIIFSPRQRSQLPSEYQMAAFVANHSERFIRENADRPWLLVFSTFEPHPPMTGPYDGMYDPAQLPVGPAFLKKPEGHALFNRARADHYLNHTVEGEDLRREHAWRKLRAQYYGNVKIIDDAVGRMVKVLEDTGQMENTIFALTSDHGEMAGDHAMLEKRAFYEESARVPMILSVPWLAQSQQRVNGVFGHADLIATLLELADQPIPKSLPGRACADVLRGEAHLRDHAAFMEWNGIGDRNLGNAQINLIATLPWRCVVTGDRWKLNLCAGDQCELFDLNRDPFEQTNLFDDPIYRDRVREMAARIRLWQHETGDHAPLPVA